MSWWAQAVAPLPGIKYVPAYVFVSLPLLCLITRSYGVWHLESTFSLFEWMLSVSFSHVSPSRGVGRTIWKDWHSADGTRRESKLAADRWKIIHLTGVPHDTMGCSGGQTWVDYRGIREPKLMLRHVSDREGSPSYCRSEEDKSVSPLSQTKLCSVWQSLLV